MNWAKILGLVGQVMFWVKMLIRWGPTVWKMGQKIYRDVEGVYSEKSSDVKATRFYEDVRYEMAQKKKPRPWIADVNRLREDVWDKNNPGKTRKPLTVSAHRKGIRTPTRVVSTLSLY
jgi:hypothetical protein